MRTLKNYIKKYLGCPTETIVLQNHHGGEICNQPGRKKSRSHLKIHWEIHEKILWQMVDPEKQCKFQIKEPKTLNIWTDFEPSGFLCNVHSWQVPFEKVPGTFYLSFIHLVPLYYSIYAHYHKLFSWIMGLNNNDNKNCCLDWKSTALNLSSHKSHFTHTPTTPDRSSSQDRFTLV